VAFNDQHEDKQFHDNYLPAASLSEWRVRKIKHERYTRVAGISRTTVKTDSKSGKRTDHDPVISVMLCIEILSLFLFSEGRCRCPDSYY
jgi:hypothetical protein